MPTWNASQYLQFADERTRPCRDLAARVGVESPRSVIDLGCGPGNSTAVLRDRWPAAQIIGLDSSPEMIEAARKSEPAGRWELADIDQWASAGPEQFDVVFSNAAMQWVADHRAIFPKLAGRVKPGGALAVQMPGNLDEAAHTLMRELAASPAWIDHFRGRSVREWHVHDPEFYYDVLSPHAARIDLWRTDYVHVMRDASAIVDWYRGTGLRPFLDSIGDDTGRRRFEADYLELVRQHYHPRADGRVLFPFRRIFFVAYRAGV